MYKRYSILVALLIVLMVSGATHAATNLWSVKNSAGNEIYINSTGQLLGMRETTEAATTSDTVTVAESGKVFLVSPATTTAIMTLPTAAAGLNYTFVVADGNALTGPYTLRLKPASTDKFVGCVSSTTDSTFANGDDLSAPYTPATGDSVKIVGSSTKWTCTQRIGTWVDANKSE